MSRFMADVSLALEVQFIFGSSKLVSFVTPHTPSHQIDTISLLGQRIVLLYYDPVTQDHITLLKIHVSSLTLPIDNTCCCMTILRQSVNILYSNFKPRGRNITTSRFEPSDLTSHPVTAITSDDTVQYLHDTTETGIFQISFYLLCNKWWQSQRPLINLLSIINSSKRTEKEFYNYQPQQGGGAGLKTTTIIDLTNLPDTVITSVDNVVYPQETTTASILQRAHNWIPRCQWQPRQTLPTKNGCHPIELVIPNNSFHLLQLATQQGPNDVIAYLTEVRAQNITTTCLRELIAHGVMTKDTILNTFLAVLCAGHNLTFLSTFFMHLLRRDQAWLPYWFAETPDLQTYSFPSLHSNLPILIPCHVQGAHWVGLVRRVVNDKVYFLYADDLNQASTEAKIRTLLQTHSPPTFYPDSAIWIHCNSTTFYPHSNECGPRTLFALAVMALHPTPSKDVLLPFMHSNLAQILRTWIGAALLTGEVKMPQWPLPISTPSSLRGTSVPGYLFPWNGPLPKEETYTDIPNQSSVSKPFQSRQEQKSEIRLPTVNSRISPMYPSLPSQSNSGSNLVKTDKLSPPHPPIHAHPKGIQLTLHDMFNQSSPSSHKSSYEEVWGHYPENVGH